MKIFTVVTDIYFLLKGEKLEMDIEEFNEKFGKKAKNQKKM